MDELAQKEHGQPTPWDVAWGEGYRAGTRALADEQFVVEQLNARLDVVEAAVRRQRRWRLLNPWATRDLWSLLGEDVT